jgi:hypothetical protein
MMRKSGGGGPKADPSCVRERESAVGSLAAVPELPADTRQLMREQVSRSFSAVKDTGPGVNWRRALDKIEISSSPESWTLAQVPARIRDDQTLKNIIAEIKNGLAQTGASTAALGNFNVGAYTNSLTEIADDLDAAVADPSGRDLMSLVVGTVGKRRGDTPFERAIRYARSAPNASLKEQLESIPKVLWRKMLRETERHLDTFYRDEIRGEILRMRECFPFAPDGVDCDAAQFNDVFGPGGKISRIAPFAQGKPANVQTRFGAALRVGDRFRAFVRSAAVIHETFSDGRQEGEGAFQITFDAQSSQVLPVRDVKEDNIFVEAASTELILGEAARFQISMDEESVKRALTVPVMEGDSRIKIQLAQAGKPGIIKKVFGTKFTTENVELGSSPRGRGAWSFLRLMRNGRSGGSCCTWEIPVIETKKKGKPDEQVAAVHVVYNFVPPNQGGSVLSGDFWNLEDPPESVTD